MSSPVLIAMATFNGEKFLRCQLESLLAQSYREWILWVRDDGSTDSTLEIVRKYTKRDSRIFLLSEPTPSVKARTGALQNFGRLLQQLPAAPYYFLCDQDDRWHEDNVALKLEKLQKLEKAAGTSRPALVHSDLQVMSSDKTILAPSFKALAGADGDTAELFRLLAQNVVTGCSCAFNNALLELALPVPEQALMHDWWLALLASAVGEVSYIGKALVDYRQHEGQVTGGLGASNLHQKFKSRFSNAAGGRLFLQQRFDQLIALKNRLAERQGDSTRVKELCEFIDQVKRSRFAAFSGGLEHQFLPQGSARTAYLYWLLWLHQPHLKL